MIYSSEKIVDDESLKTAILDGMKKGNSSTKILQGLKVPRSRLDKLLKQDEEFEKEYKEILQGIREMKSGRTLEQQEVDKKRILEIIDCGGIVRDLKKEGFEEYYVKQLRETDQNFDTLYFEKMKKNRLIGYKARNQMIRERLYKKKEDKKETFELYPPNYFGPGVGWIYFDGPSKCDKSQMYNATQEDLAFVEYNEIKRLAQEKGDI